MGAILLSVALMAAAPPTKPDPQLAAPAEPAHASSAGRELSELPAPGCRPIVAIWRTTTTWWMPVVRKTYAPGTLPSPSGSWYKHPYLAYRGSFYTAGYDFRREFDYPWHTARACPSPLLVQPGIAPLEATPSASISPQRKTVASVAAERTRGASAAARR